MPPDRTPPADFHAEAEPHGGLAPLAVAARRWPLLVVGLLIGALAGVLLHLTRTPQYQSRAELLVVKKLPPGTSLDGRLGMVEDYVGAQLTIIKSEQVRRAAAREVRGLGLKTPLPDDDGAVAEMIQAGLGVARDSAGQTPGTIGNGIVILTFRWADADDAKLFLDAVVKAYQGVLLGVYDSTTQQTKRVNEKAIEANNAKQEQLRQDKLRLAGERNRVSLEASPVIQARVTLQIDKIQSAEQKLSEVDGSLGLIKQAGKNQRDRTAVLAQLTGQTKVGLLGQADAQAPEATLGLLRVRRAIRLQSLNVDHPEIKELDGQIAYYEAEAKKRNPDDPTGETDTLAAIEKRLSLDRQTFAQQVSRLRNQYAKDKDDLLAVEVINAKIAMIDAQLPGLQAEIAQREQAIRTAQVSIGAGGYEANAVTPPGIGARVAPVAAQSALLGLALGSLLGVGAVAAAELRDKSFKSPAEIRRRLGVPVIGHVPQLRETPADPDAPAGLHPSLVAALRPKSVEAEAYRGVRTQLYFSTQGRGHQVVQITSPNPGDGKSTLAANLAISIAQSGKRTVLIDCDFRKPQVHKLFGLDKVDVGLASVVAGGAPIARALRRSPVDDLDLMPCGPKPANPAELLTSPKFQELLSDLRDQYDFVVVDTPPVLAVSDPAAVAPRVDGIVLVFKMTRNARPATERTCEQLASLGANLLGVVVNGGAGGQQGYNGYNYGSNTGYRYSDYEYADGYAADDEPAHAVPPKG